MLLMDLRVPLAASCGLPRNEEVLNPLNSEPALYLS